MITETVVGLILILVWYRDSVYVGVMWLASFPGFSITADAVEGLVKLLRRVTSGRHVMDV